MKHAGYYVHELPRSHLAIERLYIVRSAHMVTV